MERVSDNRKFFQLNEDELTALGDTFVYSGVYEDSHAHNLLVKSLEKLIMWIDVAPCEDAVFAVRALQELNQQLKCIVVNHGSAQLTDYETQRLREEWSDDN